MSAIRVARARVRVGLACVAVAAISGWMSMSDGAAVVAPGAVVADPNISKVQHPTGGVLSEIRFRDGDQVAVGDIVARLDDIVTRTNLSYTSRSLDELAAQKARLEAERDGTDAVAFPEDMMRRLEDPLVARVIAREKRLFNLRRTARIGEIEQLRERIARLEDEIGAYDAQARAKGSELMLVEEELKGARDLRDKSLVPISRLTGLERDALRLEADQKGWLAATVAQAKGRIAELRTQIMQTERNGGLELSRELWDTDTKLADFTQRKVTAEDQLRRADIRAPRNGIVQGTAMPVGSVVAAGEEIMLIVPKSETPTIEARIPARAVDRLQVGQPALLKASHFANDAAPEIRGQVEDISTTATTDNRSGEVYYTARVVVAPDEAARIAPARLKPGTRVQVSVESADKRMISGLVTPLVHFAKPIGERLVRAF